MPSSFHLLPPSQHSPHTHTEYSYHKFSVNTATFLARYCLHQFTPTFLVPYFSSPFLASLSSSSLLQYDAELISPASSKQITRCLPASKLVLINETPALYAAVVKPYIAQVVSSGAIGWVSKIVAGEKELERRLHDGDEFMIGVDTKWTSLDCKNLPREQWKGHESVRDLYVERSERRACDTLLGIAENERPRARFDPP